MVNSYSNIKPHIITLYKTVTPNGFVAICNKALGGKRGLSKIELIKALASDSIDRIHNLLEPVVNGLLKDNQASARQQEQEYNIIDLGSNEYRLIKIKNKDKYNRGANDYIIDVLNNTCTCPEFTNRLRNLSIPCKHQYMVNISTTKASIDYLTLIQVADLLDRKGFFKEANYLDMILK